MNKFYLAVRSPEIEPLKYPSVFASLPTVLAQSPLSHCILPAKSRILNLLHYVCLQTLPFVDFTLS